jgi:hypothetical protein
MSKPLIALGLLLLLLAGYILLSQDGNDPGVTPASSVVDPSPLSEENEPGAENSELSSINRSSESPAPAVLDIPEPKVTSLDGCLGQPSSEAVVDCLLGSKDLLSGYSISEILLGELPEELKYLSAEELEAVMTALLIQSSPETAVQSLLAMIELSKTKSGAGQPGTSAFHKAVLKMDGESVQALLLNEARMGERSESLYLLQAFPEVPEVENTLKGLALDSLRSEEVRTAALGALCTSLGRSDEGQAKRDTILKDVLSPYRLSQEPRGSRVVDAAVYFGIQSMLANPDGPLSQVLVEVLASPIHRQSAELTVAMFRGRDTETDSILDGLVR